MWCTNIVSGDGGADLYPGVKKKLVIYRFGNFVVHEHIVYGVVAALMGAILYLGVK